mmetsp:Transcript_7775/g.20642  ORF Transcript_7775/g.20642 Transcript_7775/m.20642 type:complete len:85 (+) Transcript_7775:1633-1887(+)
MAPRIALCPLRVSKRVVSATYGMLCFVAPTMSTCELSTSCSICLKKPTGIDWRIASSRSDVSRLTGSRLTEFIALSIDRRLETN